MCSSDLRQKYAELEAELGAATRANESLSQQLQQKNAEPGESAPPGGALLKDLDDLTRERNALAAELATLKAAQPAPRRSPRSGSAGSGMIQPSLLPDDGQ